MKPSNPSHRVLRRLNFFATFSLCIASSFFALIKLNYPFTGIDDANIYFVYARNLSNGHGFVYNVGGERVEGFTSLLWTIVSALAFRLSDHLELTLLVISVLLTSLGIARALDYLQCSYSQVGKKWESKLFWSVIYLILIFTSPRYVVWNTITLMENALWSTLLLLTTIFVLQEHSSFRKMNLGFFALSTALLLTRPESILWVVIFGTILFLRLASMQNFTRALKAIMPSIAGALLSLTSLTLFRLWYFGYPLPNTYYAKVSPSFGYNLEQGMLYLVRYFTSDPIAAISILSIALACMYSLPRSVHREDTFYLPFIGATGLLIPLLIGGDHFGSFRFYQNGFPITVLCLIYFVRKILSKVASDLVNVRVSLQLRAFLSTGLVLLLMYGFIISQVHAWSRFSSEIKTEFNVAKYERANGAFIYTLFSSLPYLPSIGVIASGGIKYTYPGEIIDLLGLNNTVMAHNGGKRIGYKNHAAFEVATFYELQPDIVWPRYVDQREWRYNETELKENWDNALGFNRLFNDSYFLGLYQYAKVSKQPDTGHRIALVAWLKKDLLTNLSTNEDFLVEKYEYTP